MTRMLDEKFQELNREKCSEWQSGKLTKEQYEQWQLYSKEIWGLVIESEEEEKFPKNENLICEEEHIFRRGYHHGFCVARNRPDVTEKQIRDWRYSDDKPQWPPGSPMERIAIQEA